MEQQPTNPLLDVFIKHHVVWPAEEWPTQERVAEWAAKELSTLKATNQDLLEWFSLIASWAHHRDPTVWDRDACKAACANALKGVRTQDRLAQQEEVIRVKNEALRLCADRLRSTLNVLDHYGAERVNSPALRRDLKTIEDALQRGGLR